MFIHRPALVIFAVALSLGTLRTTAAQPAAGTQVEQSLKVSSGETVKYLLHLPKEFDPQADKQWPVMLFLHGRGESRGPLSLVAKWGPPRFAARGDDLPYILISPQCPTENRWADEGQQQGLVELLDHVTKKYQADRTRIYLTGLSMGGQGTWTLATNHGDRFAAVAVVCGRSDPSKVGKLKDLPIWVFHGTDDKVIPEKYTTDMIAAIRAAGGKNVRYTSLEYLGHNSWSAAYAIPELYSWLLKHRRVE
jgi:predicted peptidase